VKLISACLCGLNSKYNGGNNLNPYWLEMLARGELIPVCPEQLGGLPTPRPPCELLGGDGYDVLKSNALAVTKNGQDITEHLLKGATETLNLALQANVDGAIFQSRSPSCGSGLIYDGTFSKKLIKGDGVTTVLLKQNGLPVWSEHEYLRAEGVCTIDESC
jgi:uncharacterized protein YbbK (DUF523 family)